MLSRGEEVYVANGNIEILGFTGSDLLCVVYDLDADAYGIYDLSTDTYKTEPIYSYIDNYTEDNLAAAQFDGSWGYIDREGNKAIGFMFVSAREFLFGHAPVVEGTKWGLIDTQGNFVLKPEYIKIGYNFDAGFTLAYKEDNVSVCDNNGNILFVTYNGYTVKNNIVYNFVSEPLLIGTIETQWFVPYDLSGNKLIGPGTNDPDISMMTYPVNGIMIAESDVKNTRGSTAYYLYQYYSENFIPLSDKKYHRAYLFNGKGYATACGNTDASWVLLDTSGTELRTLPYPKMGKAFNYYVEANDYYVYTYGRDGLSNVYHHGLLDLETDEVIMLKGIPQFVQGTNCIIVEDSSTELYGLLDGRELVYDYLFSNLSFDGEAVVGKRGAETFSYTPKP